MLLRHYLIYWSSIREVCNILSLGADTGKKDLAIILTSKKIFSL